MSVLGGNQHNDFVSLVMATNLLLHMFVGVIPEAWEVLHRWTRLAARVWRSYPNEPGSRWRLPMVILAVPTVT